MLKIPFISVLILTFFFNLTNLLSQGTLSFDPRDCGLNCAANDVNITDAKLYSDVAGTMLLSGDCIEGTVINAYIGITFVNNSNSNRGVIALAADVYINGAFNQELKYCPSLLLAGSQTRVFTIPIAISWTCGQSIELRDILGGWATGGSLTSCPTGCSGINSSKCSDAIPTIVVTTPPTASFTATCSSTTNFTYLFTNTSTGGAANTLSYTWDFGDGSPTSTAVNPTHTYSGSGPYSVTLTVTNSVGIDREVVSVTPSTCAPQPIRLITFDATITQPETVKLVWTVDNASDFSHFEIEKSQASSNFYTLGTVNGTTLGKEKSSFTFFDKADKGHNYYRLKMVDLDGSFNYSKIKYLAAEKPELNIAQAETYLKIENNEPIVFIGLYDLSGRLIFQKENIAQSNNTNEYIIPTNKIKNGVYLLKIKAKANSIHKRVYIR